MNSLLTLLYYYLKKKKTLLYYPLITFSPQVIVKFVMKFVESLELMSMSKSQFLSSYCLIGSPWAIIACHTSSAMLIFKLFEKFVRVLEVYNGV